jgi:hypothetical protein
VGVAALLLVLRLLGLTYLAFFVSFGGYAWFAVLALIAAARLRADNTYGQMLPLLVLGAIDLEAFGKRQSIQASLNELLVSI